MNIAFLCLAHGNHEYLEKIIKYCTSDGDDIFFHVDKKSMLDKGELINKGAYVLPDHMSYTANWGGGSLVKATINLLEVAAKKNYDRYILISGVDLPIKDKETLKKTLELKSIWMTCWSSYNRAAPVDDKKAWKGIYGLHFNDFKLLNLRTNPFGQYYLDKLWRQFIKINVKIVSAFNVPEYLDTHKVYYKGSQWWGMNNEAAKYVLDEIKRNEKKYMRRFMLMHAPDEVMFQTILMHSSYANEIEFVEKNNTCLHGLHYINWAQASKRRDGLRLLDEDLPELLSTEACFARKVDPIKNRKMIDSFLSS